MSKFNAIMLPALLAAAFLASCSRERPPLVSPVEGSGSSSAAPGASAPDAVAPAAAAPGAAAPGAAASPSSADTPSQAPLSPNELQQVLMHAGLSVPKSTLASVDFELEALAGGTTRLSSQRGSLVMLNFWATWCPPCRAEMPSMERLYQALKDKGLVILAVDLQEPKAEVAKFVKEYHLSFPVLLDATGQVGQTYGAQSIPTTWLVDRSGNVIGRAIGAKEWDSPEMLALFRQLLAVR